jgi:DNA repair protein RadC
VDPGDTNGDSGASRAPRRGTRWQSAVDALDDVDASDLLAIVIGGARRRAREEARSAVDRCELAELSRMSADHLALAFAWAPTDARRVAAAFALGRRAARASQRTRAALHAPARVHELMATELAGLTQETFHVLLLDGKHRLRRRQRISEGTLTTSLVHPREVFGPAVRECAAALICVHNHPSGDPEPSPEDLDVTRRLIAAGRLLGVPVLDHVVVGGERFVSIRERINFDAP